MKMALLQELRDLSFIVLHNVSCQKLPQKDLESAHLVKPRHCMLVGLCQSRDGVEDPVRNMSNVQETPFVSLQKGKTRRMRQ